MLRSILCLALIMLYMSIGAQTLEWSFVNDELGGFATILDTEVDDAGNFYVLIKDGDGVDLDPGPGTVYVSGAPNYKSAIVKYDPDGNYLAHINASDIASSLRMNAFDIRDNYLAIGGEFSVSLNELPYAEPCDYGFCGYYVVLDLNTFDYLWHHQFLNQSSGHTKTIDVSIGENLWVYTMTEFRGITDIDWDASGIIVDTNNDDVIIAGSFDGAEMMAYSVIEHTGSFTIEDGHIYEDPNGGYLIAGRTDGDVDLDSSTAGYEVQNPLNNAYLFIAKYGSNGSMNWGFGVYSDWYMYYSDDTFFVEMDTNNDGFFIGARLSGTCDLDPLGGGYPNSSGNHCTALVRYSMADGTLDWCALFQASGTVLDISSMALNQNGHPVFNIRHAGVTYDLDPGAGTLNITDGNTAIIELDELGNFQRAMVLNFASYISHLAVSDNYIFSVQMFDTEFSPDPFDTEFSITGDNFSAAFLAYRMCYDDNGDGDGIGLPCDNCPSIANAEQGDWNHNGIGDACEDADNDGLTDAEEIALSTDVLKEDTDGDGITDYAEVHSSFTDPNNPDTDGDTCNDLDELLGTCPNYCVGDLDKDGVVAGTDLLLMISWFGVTCP